MTLEDSIVGIVDEPQAAPVDTSAVAPIADDTSTSPDTESPVTSEQEPAKSEPKSELEAVQQGLEALRARTAAPKQPDPLTDSEPTTEANAEPEGADKARDPDYYSDRIPDAEWKKLEPTTRKQLARIRSERNQFREGAKRYEAIDGFMRETGVTSDQAGDALVIAAHMNAAMQGDARSIDFIVQTLEPLVRQIKSLKGDEILPEYQELYDTGAVTEQQARQLSKVAAEKAAAEARLKQHDQQSAARDQQVKQQTLESIQVSISEWETRTRETDPDYSRKEDLLKGLLRGMNAERGIPKSADEATARLDEAYRKVSQVSGQAKQAVRGPIPSAATSPRSGSAPAPRNEYEVAMAALARSRQHV